MESYQVAVLRSETHTGHILDEDCDLSISDTQKVYTVFHSINESIVFIENAMKSITNIDFTIYDAKQELIKHFNGYSPNRPGMRIAFIKEINHEYVEAVKCYEVEIDHEMATPECYINLAFIYWSFAFLKFEFTIPNRIPEEWSITGGNRYPKILRSGLKNYPYNCELHFWKRYFSEIIYGNEFSEKDCQELIEKYGDNKSNVPYFFLYLFDKEKYQGKRDDLINECNKHPTAKNLYIKSIIG